MEGSGGWRITDRVGVVDRMMGVNRGRGKKSRIGQRSDSWWIEKIVSSLWEIVENIGG